MVGDVDLFGPQEPGQLEHGPFLGGKRSRRLVEGGPAIGPRLGEQPALGPLRADTFLEVVGLDDRQPAPVVAALEGIEPGRRGIEAPARLLQMACLEGLAIARLLDCPFESDLTTTSHPSQITQLPLIIKGGHV